MSADQTEANRGGALAAVWENKRLWLLHVAGNLALLALAYGWLWIPDERVWQLGASALVAVAIVAAALWLHGGTLEFFGEVHTGGERRLWPVFQATLRRLPALAVWLAVVALILWLLSLAADHVSAWAAWLASALTLARRRPISPASVQKVLSAIAWLLNWFFVPLIFLPFAALAAAQGFPAFGVSGFSRTWHLLWRRRYWIGYAIFLFAGAYGAYRLAWWVPKVKGIRTEFASAAVRMLLAYLLAVTAWLGLLSLLARFGRQGEPSNTPEL